MEIKYIKLPFYIYYNSKFKQILILFLNKIFKFQFNDKIKETIINFNKTNFTNKKLLYKNKINLFQYFLKIRI